MELPGFLQNFFFTKFLVLNEIIYGIVLDFDCDFTIYT